MTDRKIGDIVIVSMVAGPERLARVVGLTPNGVRVRVFRPVVRDFGRKPSWARTVEIRPEDVIRTATEDDRDSFGYIYRGCALCYGADPSCKCNPVLPEEL